MKRLVPSLFCLSLAALAACAATAVPSAMAPVSKADIAATEVSLTEAIRVANVCLAQTVGPCTVPATRATIIADVHSAHDTFKTIQADNAAGLPVALTALNVVMSRLTNETPSIPAAK